LAQLFNSVSQQWPQALRSLLGWQSWLGGLAGQPASSGQSSLGAVRSPDCIFAAMGVSETASSLLRARLWVSVFIAASLLAVGDLLNPVCVQGALLFLPASVVAVVLLASLVRLCQRRVCGRGDGDLLLPGFSLGDQVVVVSLVALTTQQFASRLCVR
jgi:hypothetical protein